MKSFSLLILLIVVSSLCACKNSNEGCSATDIEVGRAAGVADANAAILAEMGSYEQECAIINIRAKESDLRKAGFDKVADEYISAAEAVLIENGLID